MKNIFFNSKKAKEEAEEKRRLEVERKQERDYLKSLVEDERFIKYIIEKRFKNTIALLDTVQNLPKENRDLEVEIRKGTIKAINDILNSIID